MTGTRRTEGGVGPLDLSTWRAAASQEFGTLRITPQQAEGFEARLEVVEVGQVSLYDMDTPPHTVERLAADIRPGSPAFCKLSLQLEGQCVLEQDGRRAVLEPGSLALYVTQRPYVLRYDGHQHSLVVKFPQSYVHLPEADIARMTADRITDSEGLGRVAVPLFEQLSLNMRALETAHAIPLVRSALDMLVTVFSSEVLASEASSAAGSAGELVRLAQAHIDEHLGEAELGPRTIAVALFISVRHLHSVFALAGTSVGTTIRERRLDRIRDELTDPRLREESIQEIGARWGMPDASHLSRVFRVRFGVSPSAFRREALG